MLRTARARVPDVKFTPSQHREKLVLAVERVRERIQLVKTAEGEDRKAFCVTLDQSFWSETRRTAVWTHQASIQHIVPNELQREYENMMAILKDKGRRVGSCFA